VIVFILILLLLAAVFGVLAAVLKITLVIVLSVLLTIGVLVAAAYYWFRYRLYRFRRDLQHGYGDRPRRTLPPDA
jgi:uncharacterized membrane protein YbhN (UPF0104 family)